MRRKLDRYRIILFTNGVLLTVEKYQELVRAGVNGIKITRHTPADPPHLNDVLAYRNCNGEDDIQLKYKKAGVIGDIIFNRCGAIPLQRIVKTGRGCTWPSHYLTINFEGDVLLCCNDYFASFPVGNVANNSIQEIWEKSYNRTLREYLCKDTSIVDICRKCQVGHF